jgi:hypothetical protein
MIALAFIRDVGPYRISTLRRTLTSYDRRCRTPLALGEIKGDIYTAVVDSLKVLDSERPIREAVLDRNDFDPTA